MDDADDDRDDWEANFAARDLRRLRDFIEDGSVKEALELFDELFGRV